MAYIDLHVHSTCSDGSFTPEELVALAKETGLRGMALTDHDLITGNKRAAAAAREAGIEFIQGMEMMTDHRGRSLHIVCLGFDEESAAFKRLYKILRDSKEKPMKKIVAAMQKRGVDISWEKILPYAEAGRLDSYSIMRYLVAQYGHHIKGIWHKYIAPALSSTGADKSIEAAEALPLVREAGGVTSLAHFHKKRGLGGLKRSEQEEFIQELVACGLDGMEAWYPDYSEEDAAFAARMIAKYQLLATGGSDFHGANRPGVMLGRGLGDELMVPDDYLAKIRKICAERQKR